MPVKAIPKILVIDDDAALRKVIVRYLTESGMSVIHTDDGSEGLLLARDSKPDLILVDGMMPGMDGMTFIRVLRKEPFAAGIAVILMTGQMTEEKDMVRGLETGADDYLLKPFGLPVLLARVRAVLRRYSASADSSEKLSKHGLELDPAGRTVKIRGREIPMTRKEFDLLAVLAEKSGRVLSVPFLLETVWGYDPADYNDPGTVEVHVSHLRKKLGPALGKRLVNVHGRGYKFDDSSEPG
ncbi:MAG: response regulator transcription factor [Elusimicrobia bacterium]|nr:response regulator transcription factor [Elusimicrobiota bacterium]